MANFSYEQYQQVVAQAQANSNGDGTKVGYFKLADDGQIAIARINISSTDEMAFASVHNMNAGGRWLKVSCHNPLGMSGASCPLCAAHSANPNGAIGKAAKKIYVPMVVSYRDPNSATGYTTPAPVVWERPAGFSRELANKLMATGDLRNTLVLITRNGKAGDMQTTYSMDILPESHPVFKPDMIPMDFSAFNNFNVARHSYWEKTVDEINTYLSTGKFPEKGQVASVAAPVSAPTYQAPVTQAAATVPTYTASVVPQAAPVTQNPVMNTMPNISQTTDTSTAAPSRNFSGFSF